MSGRQALCPPPLSSSSPRPPARYRYRHRGIHCQPVARAVQAPSRPGIKVLAQWIRVLAEWIRSKGWPSAGLGAQCCQHRTPATAPSPEDEQRAVSTPTALSNTVPTALCNTVTVCHLRTKACKRLPPCELPPCEQVPIVSKEGENDRRTNSTQ